MKVKSNTKNETIPRKITQKVCNSIAATVMVALILMLFSKAESHANPITPGDLPCPCSALTAGYYYTGPYFNYKPALLSSMTLEEFVGYVVADSIMAHGRTTYPTAQSQENFINSLSCDGDTLNYLMKYLYRMADNNPFMYYNFLTSYQAGKQQPMSILPKLLDHIERKCGFAKKQVMKAEYILHLCVTRVDTVYYQSNPVSAPMPYPLQPVKKSKLTYVHNKVVDVIKGQVLPDLNGGITVFETDSLIVTTQPNWDSSLTIQVGTLQKRMLQYIDVPIETNFIYYYNPGWTLKNLKGNIDRPIKNIDEQVGNEYIVFSYNLGACINNVPGGLQYTKIRPTVLGYDGGIFPIKNGNVIDRHNEMGWGTSVPVATFKQNLQTLIDSIKNYE